MGVSVYIKFICPPTEEWARMDSVRKACRDADVDLPDEVEAFFDERYALGDGDETEDRGMEIDGYDGQKLGFVREVGGYNEVLEIDVAKMPKDCTVIKVGLR